MNKLEQQYYDKEQFTRKPKSLIFENFLSHDSYSTQFYEHLFISYKIRR